MKILYAEDDSDTATYVSHGLKEAGYQIDVVVDGKQAIALATMHRYDIYIFDRMLPGVDGLSAVKSLRMAKDTTPVIFLSGLGSVNNRVDGLRAGADDYLVKPFAMSELLARIEAIARRPALKQETTTLSLGGVCIDLLSREVHRLGEKITLNPKEFALLVYLMQRPNRIQTKSMILDAIWDIHFDPKTSIVETHISRLRAKVDKPFGTHNIQTSHGAGYCFKA